MKVVGNVLLAGSFFFKNYYIDYIKLDYISVILLYNYYLNFIQNYQREGTQWLVDVMTRFKKGNADYAEIDMLIVFFFISFFI